MHRTPARSPARPSVVPCIPLDALARGSILAKPQTSRRSGASPRSNLAPVGSPRLISSQVRPNPLVPGKSTSPTRRTNLAPVGSPRLGGSRVRPNPLVPGKSTSPLQRSNLAPVGSPRLSSSQARPNPLVPGKSTSPTRRSNQAPAGSPRLGSGQSCTSTLAPGKSIAGRNKAISLSQSARQSPCAHISAPSACSQPAAQLAPIQALQQEHVSQPPSLASETPNSVASSVTISPMHSEIEVQPPATPQQRSVRDLDMSPSTEPARPSAELLTTPIRDGRFTLAVSCTSQEGFATPTPTNSQFILQRESPRFSPCFPHRAKPAKGRAHQGALVGRVDAINSAVENLVKMTRRSLGQSKVRAKVRSQMPTSSSDLSDAAGSSSASTRCPSSNVLMPSCGVLVLDAAAVQTNFDAINLRMATILQDQERIKQGQSEIMELLRMRSADI